jgi:hypothetical protein
MSKSVSMLDNLSANESALYNPDFLILNGELVIV